MCLDSMVPECLPVVWIGSPTLSPASEYGSPTWVLEGGATLACLGGVGGTQFRRTFNIVIPLRYSVTGNRSSRQPPLNHSHYLPYLPPSLFVGEAVVLAVLAGRGDDRSRTISEMRGWERTAGIKPPTQRGNSNQKHICIEPLFLLLKTSQLRFSHPFFRSFFCSFLEWSSSLCPLPPPPGGVVGFKYRQATRSSFYLKSTSQGRTMSSKIESLKNTGKGGWRGRVTIRPPLAVVLIPH